jgi:hypothetical protein
MSDLLKGLSVIPAAILWLLKLRERLLVSKCVGRKFDMERFNHRNVNDAEVKEMVMSESHRFWKTWMIMWASIGLWKVLQRV